MSMVGNKAFAYDAKIDGIYYNFDKSAKTATVTWQSSVNNYLSNKNAYSGNVTIPESVTYQGTNYSVTAIGSWAFYYCRGLTSIIIGNSVTSIGNGAFNKCTGLTSITVETGNTVYDSRDNCNAIIETSTNTLHTGCQNTTIPNSVTEIGSSAFSGCTGLTSVTIPNSVTEICSSAFSGCTGLTSITIPNSVTYIGDWAFYNCTGLTSITIPNSVTYIGGDAFSFTAWYNNQPDGLVYAGKVAYKYKGTMPSGTHIELLDGTTCVSGSAFSGCTGLTSVTIPNSVTEIGSSAFSGCTGLTSVTIPNSVTEIGSSAFSGCSGLTSITIPNSVISIGEYAFRGCSGLTSITIPESVTSIGGYVFSGCSSLTSVDINNNAILSKNYTSSSSLKDIFGGNQVQKYIIGNGVTTIGNYAFCYCTGLTSVDIPNSVTKIGNYAFCYCTGLTSVTIPNSVTEIASDSFRDCTGLTSVTIPNSVTAIGDYAFAYCTGLTSIDIPNSVTSIGNYSFEDCTGLTSIDIPNNVTSIGYKAFSGCSGIDSFTLPDNITYIGKNAFDEKPLYVNKVTQTMLAAWQADYTPFWKEDHSVALPASRLEQVSATQTTVTAKIINKYDGVTYKLDGTIIEGDTYQFTGYLPDTEHSTTLIASIGNVTYYGMSITLVTKGMGLEIARQVTASSINVQGVYQKGDATITKQEIKLNGVLKEGDAIYQNGLDPGKYYVAEFTVYIAGNTYSAPYTYTVTANIRTAAADIVTLQPKVVSLGNVLVAATTKLDDYETNVGFEWRRTDWTDDFASNAGAANIYEGMMEGYIRNLNAEKLWKFRPYYESNSGNRYYGEWVGLDPSNTSYFEPTVHTYAETQVNGNSVLVRGYVMNGTDNVTQQGFVYWTQTSRAHAGGVKTIDVPGNAQIVEATGNIMTALLTDLEYESTYYCVAFAKTSDGDTFYGEVRTFETGGNPTGIIGISMEAGSEVHEVARYNLQGRRLSSPERGVNIIRMSDGTVRKVLVK